MSGGGLDYLQYRIRDAIKEIRRNAKDRPELVVADILEALFDVVHALDWYYAGDYTYNEVKKAFEESIQGLERIINGYKKHVETIKQDGGQEEQKGLEERVRELQAKYEQLSKELGSVKNDLTFLISLNRRLALILLEEGLISVGFAAEMLRMNYYDFVKYAQRLGIKPFRGEERRGHEGSNVQG